MSPSAGFTQDYLKIKLYIWGHCHSFHQASSISSLSVTVKFSNWEIRQWQLKNFLHLLHKSCLFTFYTNDLCLVTWWTCISHSSNPFWISVCCSHYRRWPSNFVEDWIGFADGNTKVYGEAEWFVPDERASLWQL